jgi:hypothetical protein
LAGANTVMFGAEFSVSTRPAFLTAVTSVDRAGLAEAAVATGAVDMPLKLPAPDLGTDAQPEPKSVAEAEPELDGIAAALDEAMADDEDLGAADDEADVPPELLQAAVPRASPAATADTARMRTFMIAP